MKDTLKEDNLPGHTKDNYIHIPYRFSTKDKRLGPEHVHYSEASLYYNKNIHGILF